VAFYLAGDDARLVENQVWRQFQHFEIGSKLIHSVPAIRIAERTTGIYQDKSNSQFLMIQFPVFIKQPQEVSNNFEGGNEEGYGPIGDKG